MLFLLPLQLQAEDTQRLIARVYIQPCRVVGDNVSGIALYRSRSQRLGLPDPQPHIVQAGVGNRRRVERADVALNLLCAGTPVDLRFLLGDLAGIAGQSVILFPRRNGALLQPGQGFEQAFRAQRCQPRRQG